MTIPVTIVADAAALPRFGGRDTALVKLEPAPHAHGAGENCIACDTRGDVRVLLFELDEKLKRGLVEPFIRVVVDATAAADPQAVADALVPGRIAAKALRDHMVARRFHLEDLV